MQNELMSHEAIDQHKLKFAFRWTSVHCCFKFWM